MDYSRLDRNIFIGSFPKNISDIDALHKKGFTSLVAIAPLSHEVVSFAKTAGMSITGLSAGEENYTRQILSAVARTRVLGKGKLLIFCHSGILSSQMFADIYRSLVGVKPVFESAAVAFSAAKLRRMYKEELILAAKQINSPKAKFLVKKELAWLALTVKKRSASKKILLRGKTRRNRSVLFSASRNPAGKIRFH